MNQNNAARNEGETFADYKIRRRLMSLSTRIILRGKLFWDSKEQGTYIKPKMAMAV